MKTHPYPVHLISKGRKARVYVMKSGTHYKIGVAVRPEERVKTVSVWNPHGIELVAMSDWMDPESASDLELYYHRFYVAARSVGEWFKLLDRELLEIIDGSRIRIQEEHREHIDSSFIKRLPYIVDKSGILI